MAKDLYTKLTMPSLTATVKKVIGETNLDSKKSLKVVMFGYFGVFNIGDDAILLAEINELRKLNANLDITVPSQNPGYIRKEFGVSSIPNRDVLSLFSSIINSDLIIFGGGGLVCKIKNNSNFKSLLIDNVFTVYKAIFYFILPKILAKKIIVFGIGIYPNISWFQKFIYIKLFKLADFISVRDAISYNFLSANISKQVHYEKDVAFLLNNNDISKNKRQQIDTIISAAGKKAKVGISLISTNDKQKDNLILSQVAKIIEKYSKKCYFYFFPFYTEEILNNDKEIGNRLQNKINSLKHLKIIPYSLGADGFHYFFSKLNFSICMRFHAQVFSYKASIPFVGISYDEKCKSFMNEINAIYLETTSLKAENLYSLIDTNLSKQLA